MAGLADGFLAGFNTMENHYQRQENNEYRNRAFQQQRRQQQLNNQYRDEMLGLSKQRANINAAESQVRMAGMGLQNQVAGKQLANYDADHARQVEADNLGMDATRAQIDAQRASTRANNWQADYYGNKSELANEEAQRINAAEKLRHYEATGDWAGFLKDESFKGTDVELLQSSHGAQAAVNLANAVKTGNEGEAVNNFNTLFKSKLNRNVGKMQGRDGGTVRDITAIGYEDGMDENGNPFVRIPVRVTTDKGTYNSFISEMRGIDPNDPEKRINPQELIGKIGAMGHMGAILQSSGFGDQMQRQAQRVLGSNQSDASAKEREWNYIRQTFGDEGLQRFIYQQKNQDPQKARQAIVLAATDLVNNDLNMQNASDEEKQAAIRSTADALSQMVWEPQQGAGQQQGNVSPDQQALLNQLRAINDQMGQ